MNGKRIPVNHAPAGFRVGNVRDVPSETTAQVADAVNRAKEGDSEAIGFLYSVYANSVYGYVRSIVKDHYEAEDLTQYVFAKLMTAIVKYHDAGVPFFAWLLRLARNLTIDHIRARRATPGEVAVVANRAVSTDFERTEAVTSALGTLPDDQRRVVLMRYVIGLSPGEIADQMGRSEGSIHGLHHRGRQTMRRELVKLESAPFTRCSPVKQAA